MATLFSIALERCGVRESGYFTRLAFQVCQDCAHKTYAYTLYRSHFGSRYKLGCYGYAGLLFFSKCDRKITRLAQTRPCAFATLLSAQFYCVIAVAIKRKMKLPLTALYTIMRL